jgi:hypothetical protein
MQKSTADGSNRLSDDAVALMEQFIRDITAKGYAVFGLVFRTDPTIQMGMMRNTKDDPVKVMQIMTNVIKSAPRRWSY